VSETVESNIRYTSMVETCI